MGATQPSTTPPLGHYLDCPEASIASALARQAPRLGDAGPSKRLGQVLVELSVISREG